MSSELVVMTSDGGLRGKTSNGITIFKGVPYAAPPVGELRWRETMPVKHRSGVRNAFEYGAPAPRVRAAGTTASRR
jgi:para-nitrobenzyl esterase